MSSSDNTQRSGQMCEPCQKVKRGHPISSYWDTYAFWFADGSSMEVDGSVGSRCDEQWYRLGLITANGDLSDDTIPYPYTEGEERVRLEDYDAEARNELEKMATRMSTLQMILEPTENGHDALGAHQALITSVGDRKLGWEIEVQGRYRAWKDHVPQEPGTVDSQQGSSDGGVEG